MTHPHFWPHVRRGAEREVRDTGAELARRGHRIDLLTGQPAGVTSRAEVDGVHVRYVRTPVPAPLAARGATREGVFGAVAAAGAAVSRADAVLSYLYADAYGASLVRRRRPLVLKLTGAVPLEWLEQQGQRVERALLRRALDAADEVWVNSRYVAQTMATWGRELTVVPAPLDTATFRPTGDRDPEPLVLCTAAPDEPRKRLPDLLRAWPAVRARLPGARLVLAGVAPYGVRNALLETLPSEDRLSVRFAGRLGDAALVRLYSRAWATVAPAVHEALGLATLESLACGTPVAGASSGATPELLGHEGTGTLFPPGDAEATADAVVGAVALSTAPGARERCRAAVAAYACDVAVDRVERRLRDLIG